jgi:transcriptional regulator with PAS, ATPase and Fis domain
MNDPNRPFVAVNCASLPENLVESELFGYERGAFTGAQQMKTGLFEAASGGDIFLDEIGELSIDLQAKLLRVLQEKTVRRLGSDRERPVNVRVIAATNVDLPEAMEDKAFREDLFYRLNVHPIQVAPLRNRRDDIKPLLKYFTELKGIRNMQLEPEAEKLLMTFNWPGNIRQLRAFSEFIRPYLDLANPVVSKSVVEHWMSFNRPRKHAEGSSVGRDPAAEVQQALASKIPIDVVNITDGLRRGYVEAALAQTNNNRSQAARALGLSRQRLSNWLLEWGLN